MAPSAPLRESPAKVEGWSEEEQIHARAAFDLAYRREIDAVLQTIRQRVESLHSIEAAWDLNDYLCTRRHEMEGKYDPRFDSILFVFASLVREGLLNMSELDGLSDEKKTKILAMSKF
jgi:hypothetical protein